MPDLPAGLIFPFLFLVALGRGGATYVVGRAARGVADRRSHLATWRSVRSGEAIVRRFGAPAVSLCFLTVGVQTAVNAAAGSLRMPLRRYLPALAVGALLWATIYTTVGFAALAALWGGRAWVPVVALVALVALTVAVRSLLSRGVQDASGDVEPTEGPVAPDPGPAP